MPRYKPDVNDERGRTGEAYDRIFPVIKIDFDNPENYEYFSPSLFCPVCGKRFDATLIWPEIDKALSNYEAFWGYKAGSDLDRKRLVTNRKRKEAGKAPIKRRKRVCWGEAPGNSDYYFIHFVVPIYPIKEAGWNQPTSIAKKPIASHRMIRIRKWDTDYWATDNYLKFGWDTIKQPIIDQFLATWRANRER